MKSVGEVMAIGRSFNESLQKALRSLEVGLSGLDEMIYSGNKKKINKNNILNELKKPLSDRILLVGQALRMGKSIKSIHAASKIDPWFIGQIKIIIDNEK